MHLIHGPTSEKGEPKSYVLVKSEEEDGQSNDQVITRRFMTIGRLNRVPPLFKNIKLIAR